MCTVDLASHSSIVHYYFLHDDVRVSSPPRLIDPFTPALHAGQVRQITPTTAVVSVLCAALELSVGALYQRLCHFLLSAPLGTWLLFYCLESRKGIAKEVCVSMSCRQPRNIRITVVLVCCPEPLRRRKTKRTIFWLQHANKYHPKCMDREELERTRTT